MLRGLMARLGLGHQAEAQLPPLPPLRGNFVSGPNAADTLARTAWGEARSQGACGMQAVCFVAINRARQPAWWGRSVAECCVQAWQFSCWNSHDPNRALVLAVTQADPMFKLALSIATATMRHWDQDTTNGADHYHERHYAPPWAIGQAPVATIGDHVFYRLGPG